MDKRIGYIAAIILLVATTVGSAQASGTATIALVAQFGFPSLGVSQTRPRGINNNGVVVGSVVFGDGVIQGFERFKSGSFATLIDPSGDGTQTEAAGINDSGEIVGFYKNAISGSVIGFTLSGGVYTDFLGAPPDCNNTPCTADLFGVSNNGNVVGGWFPPAFAPEQGFAVLAGVFTPITSSSFTGNNVTAISSNSALMVGEFSDSTSANNGYMYNVATKAFTTINFPGAVNTLVFGVNNRGTLTGQYTDIGGAIHGFARISGQWASYDFPGANNLTSLSRVNDSNLATGTYLDTAGVTHGLLVHVFIKPGA